MGEVTADARTNRSSPISVNRWIATAKAAAAASVSPWWPSARPCAIDAAPIAYGLPDRRAASTPRRSSAAPASASKRPEAGAGKARGRPQAATTRPSSSARSLASSNSVRKCVPPAPDRPREHGRDPRGLRGPPDGPIGSPLSLGEARRIHGPSVGDAPATATCPTSARPRRGAARASACSAASASGRPMTLVLANSTAATIRASLSWDMTRTAQYGSSDVAIRTAVQGPPRGPIRARCRGCRAPRRGGRASPPCPGRATAPPTRRRGRRTRRGGGPRPLPPRRRRPASRGRTGGSSRASGSASCRGRRVTSERSTRRVRPSTRSSPSIPSGPSPTTRAAIGTVQPPVNTESRRRRRAVVVGQEVPAPVDQGVERLLARDGRPATAGEESEPVAEARRDLVGRHGRHAGGGELDRERDAVEAAADLGDRRRRSIGRGVKPGPRRRRAPRTAGRPPSTRHPPRRPAAGGRAARSTAAGRRARQRLEREHGLARRLPAPRGSWRGSGGRARSRAAVRRTAAVPSTRCSALSSSSRSSLSATNAVTVAVAGTPGTSGAPSARATSDGICAGSPSGASSASQTPSGKRSRRRPAASSISRVLPVPPVPTTRDQPMAVEQRRDLGELALPADEARELDRQVRPPGAQRAKRWERPRQVVDDDLVDLLGAVDVAQAVRAKIDELDRTAADARRRARR